MRSSRPRSVQRSFRLGFAMRKLLIRLENAYSADLGENRNFSLAAADERGAARQAALIGRAKAAHVRAGGGAKRMTTDPKSSCQAPAARPSLMMRQASTLAARISPVRPTFAPSITQPRFRLAQSHRTLVAVIDSCARSAAKVNDPRRDRMMKPLIPDQQAFRQFLVENSRVRAPIDVIAVCAIRIKRCDRCSLWCCTSLPKIAAAPLGRMRCATGYLNKCHALLVSDRLTHEA